MELARGLDTLLAAAAVAALAPVLVALLPGPRLPQVVVLLAGGVLIGPEVLDWASRLAIDLLANVGLGFLFLLAGYELDLHLFRERPGRLAIVAWLVSVALAVALVGVLAAAGLVRAFVPVALGLTTTSLGTLLPILRHNDMLGGRFGLAWQVLRPRRRIEAFAARRHDTSGVVESSKQGDGWER